jgi:hypothetical protein
MKSDIFYQYVDKITDLFRITREDLFSKTKRRDIADARNSGVECFVEIDFLKWHNKKTKAHLLYFANILVKSATLLASSISF